MLAILFGIGVFLIALAQFSKRRTSNALAKALFVGVFGFLASNILFTLGEFVIAIAFIAIVVAAVVLLVQKLARSAP